jgi:hypothetical protein
MAQSVETPVAIGEVIDKITILETKAARFTDAAKARNVQHWPLTRHGRVKPGHDGFAATPSLP